MTFPLSLFALEESAIARPRVARAEAPSSNQGLHGRASSRTVPDATRPDDTTIQTAPHDQFDALL
jgi:hypothetical protein